MDKITSYKTDNWIKEQKNPAQVSKRYLKYKDMEGLKYNKTIGKKYTK